MEASRWQTQFGSPDIIMLVFSEKLCVKIIKHNEIPKLIIYMSVGKCHPPGHPQNSTAAAEGATPLPISQVLLLGRGVGDPPPLDRRSCAAAAEGVHPPSLPPACCCCGILSSMLCIT